MHVTIEEALQLLSLSSESEPKEDSERELLLCLVDGWLDKHGKSWVKNNPLLQHEWRRQKALLSELSGRGNEGAGAQSSLRGQTSNHAC
jgi:hypothetical protein